MTVATKNGQVAIQIVRDTVTHHGATRDELIPILNDLNRQLGYLSGETLNEVSRLIGLSRSQLFGVASFYQMLSTKPLGQHVIQFCESAPCHVVGGRQLWDALREELKLNAGETSADGKWSLITVSCLGVCAVGPVLVIDDDMYGNVEPAQLPGILARYE
jgi:NADH:ubiquinone oxidoreductase subunit E